MRLSSQQIQNIINALHGFLENQSAELRLFGSRVDDNLKGGDIDLLLITKTQKLKQQLSPEKYRILSTIKNNIGDQKIDLKIISQQETLQDEFVKNILPSSVILNRWH